ncbi:hypothetical protein Syun_009287 [Stephania yunnanensis]|uniref:Uncharacterized protein n=1 Tax=Stephania yunnanensis TaxID=152371 RepID=A0AAP0KFW3_9MAGN
MACSKTPVTREEVGVEVSRGNRGRGGRRPSTTSYPTSGVVTNILSTCQFISN